MKPLRTPGDGSESDSTQGLQHSARSGAIVMIATLLSRLLGFVRIGIISALFGGGQSADIINLVFNIPNNLRKLLAEGALSTAFVPVLSRNLIKDPSRQESQVIVRSLLGLQLIILTPLLIFTAIYPQAVTGLLLNFDNPESQIQAARLFRFMAHYILFISASAVLMGTLNSNERFVIPALTPLMFSICVISSLLLFHQRLGIFSMAVGVLAGGIAQLLFQLPQFMKLGYRLGFRISFSNPEFRTILRNWLPVLLTSAVFAINQFVASRFASEMEVGSGTAMQNAIVFWQLPYGIFSASIITVLYPRISKQIGQNLRKDTAETVEFGLSALVTFLVPSSIALIVMGPELISTALQRGAFTADNTILTSGVLMFYSPGLVFVGINTFLQRLCFSDGDIRLPMYNALLITIIDISLSLWLKETALRVKGLALANTLSYILASGWLLYTSRKRFPQLQYGRVLVTMIKVFAASVPALFVMLGGRAIFGDYWMAGASALSLLKFLAVAIPAVGLTLLMFVLFKLDAINLLLKRRKT